MTTRLCLAALAALFTAHAAHAQVFQAYRGTLASGDVTLSSGEFSDVYTITVPRGAATLMVSMVSTALDSYVLVRGPGGENEDNDDRPSGGLDATAMVFNPAPGEWRVTATSARPAETGAYELVLGAGRMSDVIGRLGTLTEADYQTEGRRAGGGSAPSTAGRSVPLNTGRGTPAGRGAPAAATASGAAQVQVINRTDQALFYLHVSRCTDTGWGDDRLGSSTVLSGNTYTFALEPGCWDLRAKFQNEQEVVRRSWELVAGPATWTITSD